MSTSVTCPDCEARLTFRTTPAPGARLKCPKCSTQFTYTDPGDAETSPAKESGITTPKKSAISANPQTRRRSDPDEEEQEDRKPLKKNKAGSKTGLIIGLAVGAGALVFLGIAAVAVVLFIFMRDKPAGAADQANAKAPQEAIDPANPPGKDQGDKGKAPPVLQPKKLTPEELYGEQGGEKVAPADAGIPGSLMRARRDDTFIKLSNPRVDKVKEPDGKGKGVKVSDALLIDYIVVRRGKYDGGVLVVHTDDGRRAEIGLNFIQGRDQGTIELVGVTSSGFGFFKKTKVNEKTEFPKDAEFYITRGDDRYRPLPKFMVSNSVVMGVMKVTTVARDWTPEEISNYGKPPAAYLAPNYHPDTVGENVPLLNGWPWKNRYVEPEGRLLGVDYRLGEWSNQKRIGGLVPVFSQDQPTSNPSREIAKAGYAVAGAEVNYDKDRIIFGLRLLYRRVKTDNTLDANDSYAGEWIGSPPAGAPTVLANDGRRVIGMSCQNGAVIDRFALVVAK